MCSPSIDYQALFTRFNEHREALLQLPASVPGLSERNQRSATEYLEDFYEVLDNQRRADRYIIGACRG
jgi:hypothetical protein